MLFSSKKLLFFVCLFAGLFFLFFFPKKALGFVNCCGPGHPDTSCRDFSACENNLSKLLNCCYSSCPYSGWTDTSLTECQANIGNPTNTCCESASGCPSQCGNINQWHYCYGICQKKASERYAGRCDYQYRYSYVSCAAYDTCESGPYLKAGRCGEGTACDSSGCKVGGTYKTCCQVSGGQFTGNLGGNCTGGCRTGVCPSGSSPVICGVSSCAGISAPCTTAPCGVSACQAVKAPAPTSTSAPAPTPTSPPSAGSNIWIFVDSETHYVGDSVQIQVCQKPNNCWDGACFYDSIPVKIISGPSGVGSTVCTVSGYQSSPHCNSCATLGDGTNTGQDKNCTWNTAGWPAGTYTLQAYYGGHSDPGCSDAAKSANVTVQLNSSCPSNLQASCLSSNQVRLTWTGTSNATSYTIGVCNHTTDPNCQSSASYSTSGTSYTLNVSCNNWYGWWVTANPSGCSVAASSWFKCDCLTPTSTPTSTPTLKPCNASCTKDSECATGYCYAWWYGKNCRNLSCPDREDCICQTCQPATAPNLYVLNNRTYENAIDFGWTTSGSTERQYQRWDSQSCGSGTLTNFCPISGSTRTETINTNDADKRICVRVRGKNYAGTGNCPDCVDNNNTTCCVSDWSSVKQCAFCKHPTNVATTRVACSQGGQTWTGTRITWSDNSNVEDGFVLYRCQPKDGTCPDNTRNYFTTVSANATSYTDCTPGFTFDNTDYAVRCYTTDCGQIPPPIITTPFPTPSNVSTPTPTNTPTPTFTPTPTPVRAWFQTKEGNVVGESVVSIIPSYCTSSCSPACYKYLSLKGEGETPGIVSVKESFNKLALGSGSVSELGWLAYNPFPKGIDGATYDYISNRLAYEHLFTERQPLECGGTCLLPSETGVYQKTSSDLLPIYLEGGNLTDGKKVVIFVDGETGVKITGNITVDNQSFFALVVKGDLMIDPSVTQAQGIFFANGRIILPTSGASDQQFVGQGSFVGKQGISIRRNLGGETNKCKPAALFMERPDFMINFPPEFAYNRSVFQEVAP